MDPARTSEVSGTPSVATHLLARQRVELQLDARDRRRIPAAGPFVVVANRQLPGIDELLLWEAFAERQPCLRILTTRMERLPEALRPHAIELPFLSDLPKGKKAVRRALKAVRAAIERGCSLALVVRFGPGRRDPREALRQRKLLFRFLRKLGLPVVPVRLAVRGSALVERGLRAAGRGMRATRVAMRIGRAIPADQVAAFERTRDFRRYLQARIFALGMELDLKPLLQLPRPRPDAPEPIAPPEDSEAIAREIEAMRFANLLASQGPFDVLVAQAHNIPVALREIGRLRELAFREVGEGTGKARDLDEYDLYYLQLIIWDREARRIAGGYRMGPGDRIFAEHGAGGFYISSLFKVKPGFWPIMQQAVELGRSYVVPDYQRKRLPLFLLWKGILYYLLRHPQYRYLYGPVSISKHFSHLSRSLIVAFIRKYFFNEELARYLEPRKPFRVETDKVDLDALIDSLDHGIQSLDQLIEDIEPDHIRLPVLIRQYIKLNARFISFNVDPDFNDVLDGFIILDLHDVPYSMIEALKKETE